MDEDHKRSDCRSEGENKVKCAISWHEECLKNEKSSLQDLLKEKKRMDERILRLSQQIAFYQVQIDTAKENGKDGFDQEKYLKKIKNNKWH